MKLQPKNQHQLCIGYLIYMTKPFSLADVIKDSNFIKFQSRLSDVESDVSCIIAKRERKEFTNRFGRKSSYNLYSACVPKEKLIELFNKYE